VYKDVRNSVLLQVLYVPLYYSKIIKDDEISKKLALASKKLALRRRKFPKTRLMLPKTRLTAYNDLIFN
jgi:hypothetical protein